MSNGSPYGGGYRSKGDTKWMLWAVIITWIVALIVSK